MDLKKGQEIEAKAEAKEFPSGLVIICGLILLAALLTYIIPGGEYVRTTVDGREMVDPNSFRHPCWKFLHQCQKDFRQPAGSAS